MGNKTEFHGIRRFMLKCSGLILPIIGVFCVTSALPAIANINSREVWGGEIWITISGNISNGDYATFKTIIDRYVKNNRTVSHVNVNSRGGDINEAIKIGNLIRLLNIGTLAPTKGYDENGNIIHNCIGAQYNRKSGKGDENCNCTSACALIWIAGVERLGNVIGLHRPSLESGSVDKFGYGEIIYMHAQADRKIREYNSRMGLPDGLIEISQRTSPDDIYYVGSTWIEDLVYTKQLNEELIGKCGTVLRDLKDKYLPLIRTPENRLTQLGRNRKASVKKEIDEVSLCNSEIIQSLRKNAAQEYKDNNFADYGILIHNE